MAERGALPDRDARARPARLDRLGELRLSRARRAADVRPGALARASARSRARPGSTCSRRRLLPWEQRACRRARTIRDAAARARHRRAIMPGSSSPSCAASGCRRRWSIPRSRTTIIRVPAADTAPVMRLHARLGNYTDLLEKFNFGRYLWNSVFITVVATVITLLVNSMAAFALSKYRFAGRDAGVPPHARDADDPAHDRAGAELPDRGEARPREQPVGRDLARRRDADRRVPAAAIHADPARRPDRGGAHGQCERVAHLLAHRAAALGARARGARDLLGDVALERVPLADGGAEPQRELHPASSRSTPSRAICRRSGTTCSR